MFSLKDKVALVTGASQASAAPLRSHSSGAGARLPSPRATPKNLPRWWPKSKPPAAQRWPSRWTWPMPRR